MMNMNILQMLVLYCLIFRESETKSFKVIRLLGKCKDSPNAPITLTKIRMVHVQSNYFISGDIVCRRDIRHNIMHTFEGQRCINADSPDSCEKYPAIRIKNMCEGLNSKYQIWSPFVRHITPRMACPIKKGVYKVVNGTFDDLAASMLPFGDWYWKIEARFIDTALNQTIACLYAEVQLVAV